MRQSTLLVLVLSFVQHSAAATVASETVASELHAFFFIHEVNLSLRLMI